MVWKSIISLIWSFPPIFSQTDDYFPPLNVITSEITLFVPRTIEKECCVHTAQFKGGVNHDIGVQPSHKVLKCISIFSNFLRFSDFYFFFFNHFGHFFFISLDFIICLTFLWIFFGFDGFLKKFLRLLLKVTKDTTGYQKWPKSGKNSIIRCFLAQRAKKLSSEAEVVLRIGLYLLVTMIV